MSRWPFSSRVRPPPVPGAVTTTFGLPGTTSSISTFNPAAETTRRQPRSRRAPPTHAPQAPDSRTPSVQATRASSVNAPLVSHAPTIVRYERGLEPFSDELDLVLEELKDEEEDDGSDE